MAQTVTVEPVLGGVAATVTDPATSDDAAKSLEARRAAFLRLALKRFETAKNAENGLRKAQVDDQNFAAGAVRDGTSTQWDEGIQNSRKAEGRPCLTINRIPSFIHQVTNASRAARPAMQAVPRDNKADPDTAEVLGGLLRQIEQASFADVHYNTASDHQARIGRGWLRVVAEYAEDASFDIDLWIKAPPNPFAVFADPSSLEPTGFDLRYAFIVDRLPADEYRLRYKREPPGVEEFQAIGMAEASVDWAPEGGALVAEYWAIEYVDDTASLLDDGAVWLESQGSRPEGDLRTVVRQRPVKRRQVAVAIIDGVHVLEGNDDLDGGRAWPGPAIPLVPVIGEAVNLQGKVDYRGVTRDAKDPMRMYNYWATALTEKIALEPKAPFVVDFKSIAPYKALWDTANRVNYAYLPYNSTDPDDPQKQYPPPGRQFSDPAGIQAMVIAIRQADNDLKATTGFYDASLGNAGPEQSGKAILARQQQGTLGASHYQDNLALAIRSIGQHLVWLIPHYYDVGRMVRILGLDDKPRTVMVYSGEANAPTDRDAALSQMGIDPASEAATKTKHIFDLGVGRYDVTILAGPNYKNQAEQDNEILGKLIQAVPEVGALSADIIVENTQFRGKDRLAKRIRAKIPGLEEEGGGAGVPPEVQQQMGQMQQQMAAMAQELEAAKSGMAVKQLEVESRERIAQLETASRERIAAAEMDAKAAETAAKIAAEERITILEAKLEQISQAMTLGAQAEARREGQVHDAFKTRAQIDAQARLRAGLDRPTEPRAPKTREE